MHILSIEPTPSPNSMKVVLSERLQEGKRITYTPTQAKNAPPFVLNLLSIHGVKSIYHAADFIAIDRIGSVDWQPILAQVHEALGGAPASGENSLQTLGSGSDQEHFGEVQVMLQHFRGIPLQIRVQSGLDQQRAALPERFSEAAIRAASASPNLIKERSLEDWGVRYGDLKEVLDEITQEIDAAYDDSRLQLLVEQSQRLGGSVEGTAAVRSAGRAALSKEELLLQLNDADWKRRYAALQQIKPTLETLPLLIKALEDDKSSIRRLAVVYLGDLKEETHVLPYLESGLNDSTASVRRTAGDTLSDIGSPDAIPAMMKALTDNNKLVRWRAARFLYEVGDHQALPALHQAEDDTEFEVRMQVKIAIERIEGGHAAEGSVWQQMTRRS